MANCWLVLLEDDWPHRDVLCGVIIHARHTIGLVYYIILFNSFFFRSFLITHHTHTGFVKDGKTNLKLFNQLFWLSVVIGLLTNHVVFPYTAIVLGDFPHRSLDGMACLQSNIKNGSLDFKEAQKEFLFPTAFNILATCALGYSSLRIKRFMLGFCPRNKRGCIGVYKRNVLTWKSTVLWFLFWVAVTFIDVAYKMLFLNVPNMYTKTLFVVWNISETTMVEGFHLVLPFFIDVPGEDGGTKVNKMFYVTKYSVEPRRPLSKSSPSQLTSMGMLQQVKNNSNSQTDSSDNLKKSYPFTQYCKLHNRIMRKTD